MCVLDQEQEKRIVGEIEGLNSILALGRRTWREMKQHQDKKDWEWKLWVLLFGTKPPDFKL